MIEKQRRKAETLLRLHHSDRLLILPNVWDVLGAKLLEHEGYEAVATASASVAFSRGYNDNQEVGFDRLLQLLKAICDNTSLPVTADIEKGYAKSDEELANNIKNLIESGIVGINIEDSEMNGQSLVPVERQCERIKLVRKVSSGMGIPLVINARTDAFLKPNANSNSLSEAITRGKYYKEAGADCFYPILCGKEDLNEINQRVELPINVLAQADTPVIKELEQLGIARLSLGPGLLRSAVTKMREVIQALKNGTGYESFTNSETISSAEIVRIIKNKQ